MSDLFSLGKEHTKNRSCVCQHLSINGVQVLPYTKTCVHVVFAGEEKANGIRTKCNSEFLQTKNLLVLAVIFFIIKLILLLKIV